MEYINATEVSPLIDKVQIKVCYVGQDPNRNGTVITKELATKFGKNLPGCPIVGYYNNDTQDFDSHNREVIVEGGKFKLVDMTKPYGFVDIGARVWFEKFMDDGVEHEYLCTEGYLWTKIYKESQRVVDQGNNQSMELSEEYEKGFWTKDSNSGGDIFIISDGLIEKLCILGSDVEPCFEGAQINAFSLASSEFNEFKNTLFSMIEELKETLNKGGSEETMNETENTIVFSDGDVVTVTTATDGTGPTTIVSTSTIEEGAADNTILEVTPLAEETSASYNLNEIPEFTQLQEQFAALQNSYAELSATAEKLTDELKQLQEFKLEADRKEKQSMIDSFYMLSDEDKKDVIANIDTYSLDDIEAKLSIICVRNKVDFKLADEEDKKPAHQFTLNLANEITSKDDDEDIPAWVKAVRQNA